MDYLYDENGMLYGFFYNGAKYFYIRDTMQNILGIIDASGACVVQYNYSAYGECISVTGDMAGTVGEVNSFRYKGYYFDRETGFFYCKSRYYLPEWKRWLNSDNFTMLEMADVNKLNLFSYCANNPIMNVDESGFKHNWIRDALGIAVTLVAAAAAIVVGVVVTAAVNKISVERTGTASIAAPGLGLAAGVATFGAINNAANAIYYNYISDGKTTIDSNSYVDDRHINRWDRLDYAKHESQQDSYNHIAWRYYSEYNLHMYGWGFFGWAKDKEIPIISGWAGSAEDADVEAGEWDKEHPLLVNTGTIILGILGL